jgi:hypothetical protein
MVSIRPVLLSNVLNNSVLIGEDQGFCSSRVTLWGIGLMFCAASYASDVGLRRGAFNFGDSGIAKVDDSGFIAAAFDGEAIKLVLSLFSVAAGY